MEACFHVTVGHTRHKTAPGAAAAKAWLSSATQPGPWMDVGGTATHCTAKTLVSDLTPTQHATTDAIAGVTRCGVVPGTVTSSTPHSNRLKQEHQSSHGCQEQWPLLSVCPGTTAGRQELPAHTRTRLPVTD